MGIVFSTLVFALLSAPSRAAETHPDVGLPKILWTLSGIPEASRTQWASACDAMQFVSGIAPVPLVVDRSDGMKPFTTTELEKVERECERRDVLHFITIDVGPVKERSWREKKNDHQYYQVEASVTVKLALWSRKPKARQWKKEAAWEFTKMDTGDCADSKEPTKLDKKVQEVLRQHVLLQMTPAECGISLSHVLVRAEALKSEPLPNGDLRVTYRLTNLTNLTLSYIDFRVPVEKAARPPAKQPTMTTQGNIFGGSDKTLKTLGPYAAGEGVGTLILDETHKPDLKGCYAVVRGWTQAEVNVMHATGKGSPRHRRDWMDHKELPATVNEMAWPGLDK